MKIKYLTFILGGLLMVSFCAPAQTTFNGLFTGYDGFGGFDESQSTAGTLTYSTPPSTPFSATISGTAFTSGGSSSSSPGVSVLGSIDASEFSTVSLNGTAEVKYDVILNGPAGTQPVYLSGSISGTASTFENTTPPVYQEMASSSITISASGIDVFSESGVTSDSHTAPYDIQINAQPVDLTAGRSYLVDLLASINLNGTISPESSATASGSAAVDPTLTLDPAEIAAGYSLEFSPGVSEVPEPGDWALFVGGIGMLALLVVKRTPVEVL
jgi:hypothetical protein